VASVAWSAKLHTNSFHTKAQSGQSIFSIAFVKLKKFPFFEKWLPQTCISDVNTVLLMLEDYDVPIVNPWAVPSSAKNIPQNFSKRFATDSCGRRIIDSYGERTVRQYKPVRKDRRHIIQFSARSDLQLYSRSVFAYKFVHFL
jgi:hypothetical protein